MDTLEVHYRSERVDSNTDMSLFDAFEEYPIWQQAGALDLKSTHCLIENL
jgi:hypothetical protein